MSPRHSSTTSSAMRPRPLSGPPPSWRAASRFVDRRTIALLWFAAPGQPGPVDGRGGRMAEPMVVDLSDPELWQDPHPVWEEARRRARTAVTQRGEPIVLRADDLDVLQTDPAF